VLLAAGKGTKIHPLARLDFPQSIGCFYATLTEFLGFQPYHDEWKLMGAAPYGDPRRFYDKLRALVHLKDDGLFEIDLSYFNYYQFHRPGMYSSKLPAFLGIEPNKEPVE
jgi:carbamoyltransferase